MRCKRQNSATPRSQSLGPIQRQRQQRPPREDSSEDATAKSSVVEDTQAQIVEAFDTTFLFFRLLGDEFSETFHHMRQDWDGKTSKK